MHVGIYSRGLVGTICLWISVYGGVHGFVVTPRKGVCRRPLTAGKEETDADDSSFWQDFRTNDSEDEDNNSDNTKTVSSSIYRALADRLSALSKGEGKRYVCRTQKGFLNVHQEPGDPFCNTNIVGRLVEGQVVTSVGAHQDGWIPHDAGGWSIAEYGGHTWLEALEE